MIPSRRSDHANPNDCSGTSLQVSRDEISLNLAVLSTRTTVYERDASSGGCVNGVGSDWATRPLGRCAG